MYNHTLLCYVKCLISLLPLSHSHEPRPHHTSVYLVTNPSTHHDPRLMNPAALMINPTPWITNMNMNHMKKRELSFLGRGGGGRGRESTDNSMHEGDSHGLHAEQISKGLSVQIFMLYLVALLPHTYRNPSPPTPHMLKSPCPTYPPSPTHL